MLRGLPFMKEEGWWLGHSGSSLSGAPPSGAGTSCSSAAGRSSGFSPSNSNRVTPSGTPSSSNLRYNFSSPVKGLEPAASNLFTLA
jgi:hypothetical protein